MSKVKSMGTHHGAVKMGLGYPPVGNCFPLEDRLGAGLGDGVGDGDGVGSGAGGDSRRLMLVWWVGYSLMTLTVFFSFSVLSFSPSRSKLTILIKNRR